MEMQKNYSGLICLPILPSKYRQIPHRPKVLAETPEVYEDGPLVHPAIPGLILTKEQRLFAEKLEVVNCDNDFFWREESLGERSLRIQWKEPAPKFTSKSLMQEGEQQEEVPWPKHCYPDKIEARRKEVANEKALLRLKKEAHEAEANAAAAQRAVTAVLFEAKEKEAAIAAHKAKEEVKEKEAAAAAAEAVAVLARLRDCQTSALAACVILKEAKQENSEKLQLRNLEWRLAIALSRLQSLIDDIEAGKPSGELQILAGENMEDEIEIMDNEIALLRKSIQVLKGKDRGL
jgi:HAMP domain-containing protein